MPLASPEKANPEFRFRAFLVTLSPKVDITDHDVSAFVKYCKKKCQDAFVVVELGDNGKRHLHACVCFHVPVEKRNIFDYWAKNMVKSYPGSIGRFACKVTIQHDHKWYDEYLRKGGEIVYDSYDRDRVCQYFPSEEQQAQLIERKGVREIRVHIADQLLSEWCDHEPVETSYEDAIRFLNYRQHVLKKTPYFVDDRKMQQMAWFLYMHRNEIVEPTVDDRNFAARKTGNCVGERYTTGSVGGTI